MHKVKGKTSGFSALHWKHNEKNNNSKNVVGFYLGNIAP